MKIIKGTITHQASIHNKKKKNYQKITLKDQNLHLNPKKAYSVNETPRTPLFFISLSTTAGIHYFLNAYTLTVSCSILWS